MFCFTYKREYIFKFFLHGIMEYNPLVLKIQEYININMMITHIKYSIIFLYIYNMFGYTMYYIKVLNPNQKYELEYRI